MRIRRLVAMGFGLLVLGGAALLIAGMMAQTPTAPVPAEADGLKEVPATAESSSGKEEELSAQLAATRSAVDMSALTPTPLPVSTPVEITIEAADITSDLHVVGKRPDGSLEVPSGPRYDEAAWYDGSPTPGAMGPSVLLGHVTSTGQSPSVFFDLGTVTVGDTVEVARADETVAVFTVYAVDSFPKDDFPTETVYGNTESPELRVITCGGEYVQDDRAHEDNVVVFAQLTDVEGS